MAVLFGTALLLVATLNAVEGHNLLKASHGEDTVASSEAAAEASDKATIVSTSVQDYLNQIGQIEVRNPTIAIPGEWLTDAKKTFVFLPIRIPQALPLDEVKMLTDGRSLLVNVVERAAQAPEDAATKKFRLVLDAFKQEANGDEKVMAEKLKEWESDEDDSKVRELIRESLTTLAAANPGKHSVPKSLTIPLDGVELSELRAKIATAHAIKRKDARLQSAKITNPHGGTATIKLRSTYLQQASKTSDEPVTYGGFGTDEPNLITIPLNAQFLQQLENDADYVVPLNDKDAFALSDTATGGQTYIKESFSVTLPYPTLPARMFAVLQGKGQLVVCMPYDKKTKAPTQPFARVPVFDQEGRKLTGPGTESAADLAPETREQTVEKGHSKPKVAAVAKAVTVQTKGKAPAAAPSSTPPRKLISIGDF